MTTHNVDVAIIGAGTAGLTAYREARKHTDSIVLIDGGPEGTTCARVGCMPSKLLIAAAEAARQVKRAPAFGVQVEKAEVLGTAVLARVRRERDRFVRLVQEGIQNIDDARRLKHHARFTAPDTLQVGEQRIRAKSIVIASGSSPNIPGMFQHLKKRLITSADVFEWQDLPTSVALFGAGVIGLELGIALHHLGVEVSVFGKDNLIANLTDPEVIKCAESIFKRELFFDVDADVHEITETDDDVTVTFTHEGKKQSKTFDYILVSAGRRPNIQNLNLEKLGVELDDKGMPDWNKDTLQMADLPVFLAGDMNNHKPLLHEASDEGRFAGYNAAHYPDIQPVKRRSAMTVVFSHPQIMKVGLSYDELGLDCTAIGEASFADQGRSRVMLENQGLLRVYAAHEGHRFLGAEMIGPAAEHLGHTLAWAHQCELTIPEMLQLPFYHPTMEEGVKTALKSALHALKDGPPKGSVCSGEYVIPEPGDLTS